MSLTMNKRLLAMQDKSYITVIGNITVYSGFKCPIMRFSCSNGLLSNSSSNRPANIESIVLSDSSRRNRRFDTTFFIGPYIDRYEERKIRLRKHHEDVTKVLQNWCEVSLSPTNQKEGFYTTSFPLYIEVV